MSEVITKQSNNAKLKELCKKLRYSQKEFSAKLGFKQSYMSDVMNGKRAVTIKILTAATTAFNLAADWYLKDEIIINNQPGNSTPPAGESSQTDGPQCVGSRLKKIRERLLITRNEMANGLGLEYADYKRLENNDWPLTKNLWFLIMVFETGISHADTFQRLERSFETTLYTTVHEVLAGRILRLLGRLHYQQHNFSIAINYCPHCGQALK